MSNRQTTWMTSSVPRPAAFSSPSTGRLSDIKGRLSFSAVKTPAFKPKQRSLVDHARSSSASNVNGYHMSKQNPDVLDRLCSPSPSHRDHLLHKKTLTPATVRVGGGGGVLNLTRNGHLLGQNSLVKQMLNDRHRAPASLVHLATRGKSFRTGVNVSPVVVKLSGATPQSLPSSLNSSREENTTPENGSADSSTRLSEIKVASGKREDPCDKNVVLSALRQRRKRWATSGPDDDHGSPTPDSALSGAPSAKRSKHGSHGVETQRSPLSFITGDRKRAYTAPSYSMSPDSKKSRIGVGEHEPLTMTTSKVAIPEFEYDKGSEVSELSEVELESGTSSKASSRAPSECIGGVDSEELQRRSLTPPIQFDEVEMNRKREESLNTLKAVFSSKGGDKKSSNRRKLPIFCATGTKPHLPTPLSTTHSVTLEDLKKDREAAAAKLREILTADEEPPPPKSEPTTRSTATATPLVARVTLSSSTDTGTSKGAPTTPLSGVRLSSTLSGSLPSLPSASSMIKTSLSSTVAGSLSQIASKTTTPSTTVSALSSGLSLTPSSTANTQQPGSTTAPSIVTTATTQQTQVKSVSFAPLPVPTPASTTQASFTFPPSLNSQAAAGSHPLGFSLSTVPPSSALTTTPSVSVPNTLPGSNVTSTLTGVQLPQFASSLAAATTASTSTSSSLTAGVQNNITTAPVGKTPGLSLGPTFVQQPSPQVALPGGGGGGGQFGIFQAPTSANTANTAGATTMGGGFLAAANATITAANSTGAAAPSTSSGGFKFSLNLPTTTQQQQQPPQPSGLMFPSTKPLSTAGSSVSTGSIFGLNSGLQTNTSKPQPSSNGTGGITFGVPQQQLQQQQPGQLSLFSGMQSQSGQNGGGLSFNFPQSKISGTQQTQASAAVGGALNFNFSAGAANSAQQNVPGGSGGLSFPAGSQSSGGLSLFNSAGNGQQSHHHQQQKPLSIFSAGGPTNLQQPNQSSGGGGLFNSQSQPQQTAAAFTGFKLSTGTSGSQAQGNQLSLFGNTNSVTANPLSGGNAGINTGGLNFTARQQQSGVGGATNGSSSTFNFSAGSQQQPTQNQGGLFAFGQKPNPTGGVNFAGNGSGPGLGIGNQAQSGNGGFNFGASTGMGLNAGGVKPSAGLFGNNSSSNIFQPPVQQQPSSNIFQTPQTQKQLSFTATPTNQQTPGQGGFAFQATPSFSSGTPGGSASRPVARARRRKK